MKPLAIINAAAAVAVALAVATSVVGSLIFRRIESWLAWRRTSEDVLGRWYWQVTYRPPEIEWNHLWSVELVKVYRRGNRVRGTMYRVHAAHFDRRWEFEGRIHRHRHLVFSYRSTGKEFGHDGTMRLGALTNEIWCGSFEAIPEPSSDARVRAAQSDSALRRIGPDFTEESLVEWVAADKRSDDEVRAYLATIPDSSPASPRLVAKHLPADVAEVLLTPPPYASWWMRGLQAASAVTSPQSLSALYAEQQLRRARPRPWDSPSRKLLGEGEGGDTGEAA
jgi:hypothetical protein